MSSNLKVNSLVPATGTEIGIGTTGGSIDFRCPATFGGNVTIGGTLTYDEVINIDSIGIVTARSGLNVQAGQLDVGSNIKLGNAGVITATQFNGGSVTGTTGTFSDTVYITDNIQHVGDSNTQIRFPGADQISFETAGTNRLKLHYYASNHHVEVDASAHLSLANNGSNGRFIYMGDANASSTGYMHLQPGGGSQGFGGGIRLYSHANSTNAGGVYIGKSLNSSGAIIFGNGGMTPSTEYLRITSDGFVGIGVTNPEDYDSGAKNLVVGSAGQEGITIRSSSPNTGNLQFSDGINRIAGITFKHDSTASNRYFSFLIDNGSSYVEQLRLQDGKLIFSNDQNSYISGGSDTFRFTTGGTERVRINGSGNLKLPDNAQLQFGGALHTGSGDLQLYHDGSQSYIMNQTSDLRIMSSYIKLRGLNGEDMIVCNQNTSVILYHNNEARAYTAADGFALSRVNTFPNPNNTGSEITGAMLDIGGNLHLEERYPAGAYSDRQDLVFRFNTGYGQGFTDKIRFTSGGKIELQQDGGGIRFPNTQTPTSAMTSRVGISSEMRYYESGEFVPGLSSTVLNGLQLPAFTDASYTRRIGRYVRVGNLVFLNIEILMAGSVTYANGSTSTAPPCITGIPFSFQYANRWASTGHPDYYPCAISYSSTGLSNDTLYAVLRRDYNAQPRIEITKPGTGGSRQYNSTNFGEVFPANGMITVSCTYCIDTNNADY